MSQLRDLNSINEETKIIIITRSDGLDQETGRWAGFRSLLPIDQQNSLWSRLATLHDLPTHSKRTNINNALEMLGYKPWQPEHEAIENDPTIWRRAYNGEVEFVRCEPKSEKQKEGKKRQSVQNDNGTEAPKRHKRG